MIREGVKRDDASRGRVGGVRIEKPREMTDRVESVEKLQAEQQIQEKNRRKKLDPGKPNKRRILRDHQTERA